MLGDIFYYQHVYVGDDCVEYNCMELKNDNERNIFFIFWEFHSERPIELYEKFSWS